MATVTIPPIILAAAVYILALVTIHIQALVREVHIRVSVIQELYIQESLIQEELIQVPTLAMAPICWAEMADTEDLVETVDFLRTTDTTAIITTAIEI